MINIDFQNLKNGGEEKINKEDNLKTLEENPEWEIRK